MLAIISKKKFSLSCESELLDNLNEVQSHHQVIIIDFDKLDIILLTDVYKINKKMRFIVLSEQYSQEEQVLCFKNDIDHYIFDNEILSDYLEHILSRFQNKYNLLYTLNFEDKTRTLEVEGLTIKFPKMEYNILKYLSSRKDQQVSSQTLLVHVLGYHESSETRLVSVYVRYLRQKLEHTKIEIITIRKIGYTLKIKS